MTLLKELLRQLEANPGRIVSFYFEPSTRSIAVHMSQEVNGQTWVHDQQISAIAIDAAAFDQTQIIRDMGLRLDQRRGMDRVS